MLLLVLVSFLYVNAEAYNGIVKSSLGPDDEYNFPDLEKELPHYTHHLECDYRHKFPKDNVWPYAYDFFCGELKDESGDTKLKLFLNYDNNVFDIFEVTTCDPKKVVNSIFPPKQKEQYLPEVDEPDELDRPTVSYIKYVTTEGECFVKKYMYNYFRNKAVNAADRFAEEKIQCEGESGSKPWTTYGEVAKFTNCRVNKLPISGVVLGYSRAKPEWTPKDEEDKHEQLLVCTFDPFLQLWDLICVKGDNKDEYFAFVYYFGHLLDRLTVRSCSEEDIVHGIFAIHESYVNIKHKPDWELTLWYSKSEKECYYRQYPRYSKFDFSTEEKPEDCPKTPDQWINPILGKMGMWRECSGPMSANGKAQGGTVTQKSEATTQDKAAEEESSKQGE